MAEYSANDSRLANPDDKQQQQQQLVVGSLDRPNSFFATAASSQDFDGRGLINRSSFSGGSMDLITPSGDGFIFHSLAQRQQHITNG